jgi:ParB/RepB/Spo0J family partition protein
VTQRTAVVEISVEDLYASPSNPRKKARHLDELAASIARSGVLQPITVRPKPGAANGAMEIVCGERRWRGAKLAKLKVVPAIVRELTDEEVLEVQLIENIQRDDLTPLEEGDTYRHLMDDLGKSVDEIAARTGKSRGTIYARRKLSDLGAHARKLLDEEEITPSVALLLARISDPKRQEEAARHMLDRDGDALPYREAREVVEDRYMRELKGVPWKLDDAELVPKAGACTICPLRSGNQVEMFGEAVGRHDVCTQPACFEQKLEAFAARTLKDAKTKGLEVVPAKEAKKLFYDYGYGGRNLRGDSGYVEIGQACGDDPKRRSYQRLLGKAAKPVVAIDPDGKVRHLLAKAGLPKLLKERGHDFAKERRERQTVTARKPTASSRARDFRAAVAKLAASRCFEAALGEKLEARDAALWGLFGRYWVQTGEYDADARLVAAGLLAPPKKGRAVYLDIDKALAAAEPTLLRAMVIEDLALHGGRWFRDEGLDEKGSYSETLEQVCRLQGLSLAGIEKDARDYVEAIAAAAKPARRKA